VRILVATKDDVLVVDPSSGAVGTAGVGIRPTCLAADPSRAGRLWCGTQDGVRRSDDGGTTWEPAGLAGEHVTALAPSPVERAPVGAVVYAGTEPSAVWRTGSAESAAEAGVAVDSSGDWERSPGLLDLPSAPTWSFPPKPDTHHVRWIACDPSRAGRLYVAIEAGALVTTADGGRTWIDRPETAPYDTHELAIHPERPDGLRVSAGDGYWESADAGASWTSPEDGLDVTYLRSVAIDPGDPEVVVVSAASHPHSAYMVGRSDGRLYRREGDGRWRQAGAGWPDPPATIAPLLAAGRAPGELWAADERGVHRSADGGASWERVAAFDPTPPWLRGLALAG
jgi:photosystem II stability/assembly factor-like uncharacterized protein